MVMADLTGRTLSDRYFLRRKVGKGGMADVYEAWDRDRNSNMAIKILRQDANDPNPQRLASFKQEAVWLSTLLHPAIVRLYEAGQDGELIFLVMDWVDGKDLRQEIELRRRPFRHSEVVQLMQPVCAALNFAHGKDVFHCDIKPANILISKDGRILLTDFGVARFKSVLMSGGTPVYMAPEQIMERPVDARTDVYSLGITLYELYSGGVLPFRGDSRESSTVGASSRERVMWEQCHLPLPPLRQFNQNLQIETACIIEKALSKDPGQRQADTIQLWKSLAAIYDQPAQFDPQAMDATLLTQEAKLYRPVPPSPGATLPPKQESPASPPTSRSLPPPRPVKRQVGYARGCYLVGVSEPCTGQVIPLDAEKTSIGRLSTCTVVLPDPTVSRLHATIIQTRKGFYLQDEGSKTGTYLNGQLLGSLQPMLLKPGDVITLAGNWSFEFRG